MKLAFTKNKTLTWFHEKNLKLCTVWKSGKKHDNSPFLRKIQHFFVKPTILLKEDTVNFTKIFERDRIL